MPEAMDMFADIPANMRQSLCLAIRRQVYPLLLEVRPRNPSVFAEEHEVTHCE